MAAAADTLTPVVAECGGKDALLVAADADLDAAADAAAWGAMSNAGQTCIGIERVYVAEPVYAVIPGPADGAGVGAAGGSGRRGASYGPMTAEQTEVVAKHVGRRAGAGRPDHAAGGTRWRRTYVRPVVPDRGAEDSAAVTEETFGPTVTVTPVAGLAEAVSFANAGLYG